MSRLLVTLFAKLLYSHSFLVDIMILLCKLLPVLSDVTVVVLCPFNGKVV